MAFSGVRELVAHVGQKQALGFVGGFGGFLGLGHLFLDTPPLRHVFHGQDQQFAVVARLELAGIEQHHPAANDREGVLELKVVEDGTLGDNVFEQRPQVGDVPLAVAQLVNQAVLGLFGRDVKGLIEGAVGGPDAQGGVEDQQGLAHRVDDVLGVGFDGLQVRLGAPPLGHVFHGQDQQFAVVARLELAGIEQHHPAANDREGVLELKVVEDGTLGDNIFEQGPQVGDVPLAVAQLVNQAVLGFFGRDVKGLVEGAVGGPDAQGGVEDQQGLAHRIDDVLGVVLNIVNLLNQWFSFHPRDPPRLVPGVRLAPVRYGRDSTAKMEMSSWALAAPRHRSISPSRVATPSCSGSDRPGRSPPGAGRRQTACRRGPSPRGRRRSRGTAGLPPPGGPTAPRRRRRPGRSGTPGSPGSPDLRRRADAPGRGARRRRSGTPRSRRLRIP